MWLIRWEEYDAMVLQLLPLGSPGRSILLIAVCLGHLDSIGFPALRVDDLLNLGGRPAHINVFFVIIRNNSPFRGWGLGSRSFGRQESAFGRVRARHSN